MSVIKQLKQVLTSDLNLRLGDSVVANFHLSTSVTHAASSIILLHSKKVGIIFSRFF